MVTSWTNTGNLVSALVFLYFSGVKGFITSPPQNTAIKVGSQTHLNCSGNNGFPGWTFGEPGISIPLVALGSSCSVVPNYASSYRGEPQGSNTCNLVILNPSLQESGVYACLDNDLASQYAVLTVLSFSGTPVVNNGSEVVEGDQLKVTCTVEYGTSISVPIAPILIWTISGINITNAETTKTNNSISSSITLVTTRDGIPSYDCTAHFLPPASTSNFASNAPSNIYIGATYPITGVYYYPGNITITGGSCVNEPEPKNLTCTADANPSAVYKWLSHANNITTNGSVLTITTDGLYECIATNCIRNQTHSDTKTNNATKCQKPISLAWIAIPIYVGLCWLLGILFALHYGKSKRKDIYDKRYPFLTKMLPCHNKDDSDDGNGCNWGWTVLYIVMVTFVGLFAIPVFFFTVQCSKAETKDRYANTSENGENNTAEQLPHVYETLQGITPTTLDADAQLTHITCLCAS